jgi:hypothetical protein
MLNSGICILLPEFTIAFHAKPRKILATSILLFYWLLILMPFSAKAQNEYGVMSGSVCDLSRAVLSGTEVSVTNILTGVKYTTRSNSLGAYTLPKIPVGKYKASFSMAGFKTEVRKITISAGQTTRLDATLEVAVEHYDMGDPVYPSIIDNKPLLTTSFDLDVIKDLPLTISGGRKIESFAYALAPAVEGDGWKSHIAGNPDFTKEVLIDGLSATSQIQGNILESSPTMESIEEFTVQTGGISAEYGHAASGLLNFALKSESFRFNGSAYYAGRNEALKANTWMNNWQLSQNPGDARFKRARDRQTVAGISAGGPVVIPGIHNGKNKTQIFGSFEHFTDEQLQLDQQYNRTVPVVDFLSGNFSQLLTNVEVGRDALNRPVYSGQIFDPQTLRFNGHEWISDPFPGNIIPTDRMSRISRKVIDIYKSSYQPMIPGWLTNNATGLQSEQPWFHQTQLTLKADQKLSQKINLIGSLIWTERPRILADQGGIWDPLASNSKGGPFARARNQNVTSRALRLSFIWTIHPTLLNTTSLVYNRYRNPSISAQSEGNWQKYLGLTSSTGAGLFPEISFGPNVNGVGTTGIGYGSSNYSVANNYILSSKFDWIHGRHTWKFGGEIWSQQMNSHAGSDVLSINFSQAQTGIPGQEWSNRVGFGFASFVLGEAAGGSKNVPFDLYGRRKYLALFFQDDFQISHSWMLNFGLRWEQSEPLHEKYGRWASFNPSLTNTDYDVKGALEFLSAAGGTFEKQRDWKEFSPRVGVAYRYRSRITVRAGYGLYFIPLGMNYWNGVPYGFAPGYRGTNVQSPSQTVARFNWDNGYPDNYQAPVRDPNSLVFGMTSVDERSLFAGYIHQYFFGMQFAFSPDMVIDAAFMGNRGRRLHNGALMRNQPSRSAYENSAVDPYAWIWDRGSAAAAGVPYPYEGFSNYAGLALQPFPQVSALTGGPLYFVGTPKGSSEYKSLQIMLTRRVSTNIAAQISYNLSRATGNSETGFDETWDESAGIQDIGNLTESAGTVLSYDQMHVLKGSFSLQLPFGHRQRFLGDASRLLDAIVGGWKVSGIFRYNSGNPLAVYPNVWYPGWEGAVYSDYNPSVNLSRRFDGSKFNPGVQNASGNQYFNTAAFTNPQNHKLGNGKRLYSELRGFGYASEDLGFMKTIRFKDRYAIQLRAEFLNLFNRHYFADPGTSLGNTSTFGYVTAMKSIPRVVQYGIRMDW